MITVFTTVFNNYGRFIPQWIEWLKKQSVIPQIIIVLGKDHGADIKHLKKNKIKYYICDSDNMGKLRNTALKHIKTKWWMYFSVDDELLSHACEEIIDTDADAVSLRFNLISVDGSVVEDCHSPCINTIEQLNNWQRCWGGYVAVKGNTDLRFNEHIEVPNLTLHFELFKRGLKTVRSKGTSAIHHRWSGSHHFRSKNIRKQSVDEIEKNKNEIIIEMLKGAKEMKIEALQDYTDNQLKKGIKKGEQYIVSKERGKVITETLYKNVPLARIVEIIKEEPKEVIEKESNKETKPKTTTKKKVTKKK